MYLPKPSKLQTEKEEQGGYFYKHNTIRVGTSYQMARKQRVIATCIKLDTDFKDLIIDLFQDIYVRSNIAHIKILQTKFLKLTAFPQARVNNLSNKYVIFFSQGYAGSPQHHIQPYALLNSCTN